MNEDTEPRSCSLSSMGPGHRLRIEDPKLRQTAFSVEQMAPGGTEREDCGWVSLEDLTRSQQRVSTILSRPGGQEDSRRKALQALLRRAEQLYSTLETERAEGLIYLSEKEFGLNDRLRSAAIEVDFAFGDRNGSVSQADIRKARGHYAAVRGPVGWNRLLLTDELERRLFPDRTLKTTAGLRLLPNDWLSGNPDPLSRLRKVSRYLDDQALARTYADVAARLATVADEDDDKDLHNLFEGALQLLGAEILGRNSVRPTITDIARIGCEDPAVKARLRTPIEMSRRLLPDRLLDRYLNAP
ncbi:MAG: hypothetical protein AAF449_04715 [Myxococcota bacterium]